MVAFTKGFSHAVQFFGYFLVAQVANSLINIDQESCGSNKADLQNALNEVVVWRTLSSGKRKGRVVVDIRDLNQMALPDVYPLPLQADITALAQVCPYITVVDCASFFYQWRARGQSLAIRGAKCLKSLIESVNEGWGNSIALTKPRPNPTMLLDSSELHSPNISLKRSSRLLVASRKYLSSWVHTTCTSRS